tara:strand:+ start:50 stop:268 length:219 start_codon:yes stop_codon:yes gene_type:complete
MEKKSLKLTFPNQQMCVAFSSELTNSDEFRALLKKTEEKVLSEYGSKFWLDPDKRENWIHFELIKTRVKEEN